MSYIEKEKLIKADIASIENRVRHAFNQGYDLGYKEGKANCSKNSTGSTTKNDLALLEKTYDDFCKCEGGEGWLKIDDKEYGTDVGYAIEGVDIFMEVFKRRLAELPSVTPQEPRWIPVSERYPKIEDEYKYFLVTDDKGKVSVQEFFISLDEEPQPYFSGMVNVLAWKPLPKPYEPQESEGKE